MNQGNNQNELSGTLGSLNNAAMNNITDQNSNDMANLNGAKINSEDAVSEIEMLDFEVPTNNNEVVNNQMDNSLTIDNNLNSGMVFNNDLEMPQPGFDNIPTNFDIGDIGSVPPVNPNSKNQGKKKKNIWFILIVIVLILIVGALVFYYLRMSKDTLSNAVTTKNITLEIGESLSTDINDYATFTSISSSNCILNTDSVEESKIGTYNYKITCGSKSYDGKVIVQDKTAPQVVTKTLVKKINDNVTAEEFITDCIDAATCSYELENVEDVNEYLKQAGTYDVNLIISDANKNTITTKVQLVVIESDIKIYLNCASSGENEDGFEGTTSHINKIGINSKLAYAGIYFKSKEYIASTEEEYYNIKNNFIENKTLDINGGVGIPSFDDENLTITIEELLTGTADFGEDYSTIKNHYETLNYRCNLIPVN